MFILTHDKHGLVIMNLLHLGSAASREKSNVAIGFNGRDGHGPRMSEVFSVCDEHRRVKLGQQFVNSLHLIFRHISSL